MNISHCYLLLWCDWTPPPHQSLWISSNLTAATDVFLKSILVHVYTLSLQEIKSKFLDRTRLHSWIHSPFPCTLASTLSIAPCFDTSFFKISFYCAFNVLSILDFSHLPMLCQAQTFAASAPLCLEHFFWLFWPELSLTFHLRHHFWNTSCFYKFQSSLVCVSLGLNVLYKSCSPLCFQLFRKRWSHSFLKKKKKKGLCTPTLLCIK